MKKITFLIVALIATISTFAADYYVAGSSALCGSNWSQNDANNKMVLVNGIYTKSYSIAILNRLTNFVIIDFSLTQFAKAWVKRARNYRTIS